MTRQPIPLHRLVLRAALLVAVVAASAGAAEDLERARAMFQEALVLEVAGDWASALAKLQLVARTRLTPQVRYHLARCKEHLGRLTEALGDYRVAETEALSAALPESGEMIRARRDLEARVPKLLLRLVTTDTAISVDIDGVAVGASALNRPMVVNPGQHRITLRGPSGIAGSSLITAEEGKFTEVDLKEYDQSSTLRGDALDGNPTQGRRSLPPTWAYVSAGVGTAAIASSVVLFVVRENAIRDLEQNCVGQLCPESMRGVQQRGEAASTIAPVALGLGIAGIGLAAWGLWGGTQGSDSGRSRGQGSTVSAAVAPGGWGVNIAADF